MKHPPSLSDPLMQETLLEYATETYDDALKWIVEAADSSIRQVIEHLQLHQRQYIEARYLKPSLN